MTCRPFILGIFPLIECFIHHHKANLIAEIIKLRHMRIMAASDSVAARLFKELETSSPDLFFHGSSKATSVMMNADTFEFHALSIK